MPMDLFKVAEKASALLPKGIEVAKQLSISFDQRAQYEFRTAHIEYCTNVIKKYCRARTFFIRDEPQYLEDFYVAASIIKSRNTRVEKAGVSALSKISRRCVVTGSGGSGKTIFMRHLLHNAIETGAGYPVFIELRAVNEMQDVALEKLIAKFMKEHGFPLHEDLAVKSLKEGLLIVLLDGFDEVVFSKRKQLEIEIKKLGSTSTSQIVVSSRADMALEGWDGFSNIKIAPLEIDEACDLIKKITFEEEIKTRFIEKLREGLFKTHKYFLSNPLLLSIMLLTYGDSADIPKKFASFYEQAYTALFQKHDALKSGFRRQRNTDLDIYGFSKLFSAFSAITYEQRAFRFSTLDAINYAKQANRVSGFHGVDPEGFLDDARQAVCLLVEDGLDISFVHRSFQEYFVAKFIAEAEGSLQKKYVKKISSNNAGHSLDVDNVIKILYEISPSIVEDNYLIPNLDKFFGATIKRKLSISSWRILFRKLISSIQVHEKGFLSYTINSQPEISLIFFAEGCMGMQIKSGRVASVQDFDEYCDENRIIKVKNVPEKSSIWREISEVSGIFSLNSLEIMRIKHIEIKRRANERLLAIDDVFSSILK